MKDLLLTFSLLMICLEGMAQGVPFPNPYGGGPGINTIATHQLDEGKSELQLGLWTQARIMYNMSNIPGPGGSILSETSNYDFFRQRVRFGADIRFVDTTDNVQVGAYTQLEYRGGWGGSSPAFSDPRASAPTINPYNNIQPRGIRYGYAYAQWNNRTTLVAGILPLTDAYGGVLFDADWDFNVGGIALGGPFLQKGKYRLGLVRLIDGVGGDSDQVGKNGQLILAEQSYPIGDLTLGASVYHLNVPEELLFLGLKETWLGATLGGKSDAIAWKGSFILNTGEADDESHTGLAIAVNLDAAIGSGKLSVLGLMSTGDELDKTEKAFITPHALLGTGGYWAKAHIFTPNGPSDVNDFGLEAGNRGRGLTTLQLDYGFPISASCLNANIYAAWFNSSTELNASKNMGLEFGAMLNWQIAKFLHWELGGAYASLGDYYGDDPDGIYELFSRFQFEW